VIWRLVRDHFSRERFLRRGSEKLIAHLVDAEPNDLLLRATDETRHGLVAIDDAHRRVQDCHGDRRLLEHPLMHPIAERRVAGSLRTHHPEWKVGDDRVELDWARRTRRQTDS